jgi:hypothetical protein
MTPGTEFATRRPVLTLTALTAISWTVWAASVVLLIGAPGNFNGLLRSFAAAIAVAALVFLARCFPRLILSPLFMAGGLSIGFYSVVPWALFAFLPADDFFHPGPLADARAYLEGRGELVVLQFALLCLSIVLTMARRFGPALQATKPVPDRLARALLAGGAILIAAALAIFAVNATGALPDRILEAGSFDELMQGAPALLSLGVAAFFVTAAGRDGLWLTAAISMAALACAGVFSTAAAKAGIFITVSGVTAWLVHAQNPGRRIAWGIGLGLIFVVVTLTAISMIRPSTGVVPANTDQMYKHFVRKIFVRQAATGACLHRVLELRLPAGFGHSPFYFLTAPVPGALWPDKPNLSRGQEYAIAYCWFSKSDYEQEYPHSASITLLGEPVAEAGWVGLAIAQTIAIAAFVAVTLVLLRTGPPGTVASVAMLPWLIDFDQHFAMFFALSIKMFVWMIPALALFWMAGRFSRGRAVKTVSET